MLHSVSTFFDILFPMRYLYKSGEFNKKEIKNRYDYLCVPKVSKISLSIWLLNKKARIQLFEEGMGTYYGGQHMCYEYNTHQDFYQLLNGGKEFAQYEAVYVNDSRLYLGEDKDKVIDIPKYDNNYLKTLKNTFSSVLFKDTNKNIYWIGQYMIGVNSKDDLNVTIANALKNYKNSVVFCPHPRIELEIDKDIERLESNKAWELSLLNIDDIKNKCFISIYSTAIFSAKLLYDVEPYMILTIKLLKNEKDEHFKTMEKIIDIFKTTYRNPNKIMIPNTKEELNKYIKEYMYVVK